MTLIDVQHLTKTFIIESDWRGRQKKTLTAVHDMSLTIEQGETVGLVGESGCGKSTFARTVMGLYKRTRGTVFYKGQNTDNMDVNADFCRHVQMIFQDPYASLDPRMTVADIIGEPLRNYHMYSNSSSLRKRIAELLEQVELNAEAASRYPHEFSGGQRQRIGIARALALQPECIFCDEPISALDVSVQVQIVNMLQALQQHFKLAYLFIAHDLAMVHHISHRIGVMYLGRLVEMGPGNDVYRHPLHPYTQMLIAAIPRPDPHAPRRESAAGEVPSPMDAPPGCVFHTRCSYADERCRRDIPVWREIRPGRFVACHHVKGEDAQ